MAKTEYTPAFTAQVNSMFSTNLNQITIELLVGKGIISVDDAVSIYAEVARRSQTVGGEVHEAVANLAVNAAGHYAALKTKPEGPAN